ncbi:bZIP transcription factor [archaeon]|nr:MAG: bZIP transcription factor [archaeon]
MKGTKGRARARAKNSWPAGGERYCLHIHAHACKHSIHHTPIIHYRERNRVLARKTRLRKKFFFESLQRQVNQLSAENEMLKSIIK